MNYIPIHEIFYSIQGEGYYSGKAAFFIRLAGCDVGCVWCDSKETWKANKHNLLSIEQIIETLPINEGTKFVVITGGEPSMYKLNSLTKCLKEMGFYIAVETSGVYNLEATFDWITLSPKKHKPPTNDMLNSANELKVVIASENDFVFASSCALKTNSNCRLYLQTEWSRRKQIMPLIIEFVKSNPKWKISLQMHKLFEFR